jgi:ketosteroid isomerase-like protein
MRQTLLPALLSLLIATPALAQDASGVDIMDIYQKERRAHREKIADAAQRYHDRWFEHVNERYGVTLKGMSAEPAGHAMFDKYKTYEAKFDSALADLYSDDAVVGIFWTDENKKPMQMILKGSAYKEMIRNGVEKAAEKKDKIEYADVTYESVSDGILISGKKTSKLRGESTNFKIFMRPRPDGQWLIEEEKLETIAGSETTASAEGSTPAADSSSAPAPAASSADMVPPPAAPATP